MGRLKIAVIGSGISGLSCAWYLSKKYKIDIYEKNNYYGGHSNTHTFKIENKMVNIDTGFIVFNELNYKNLCNFFNTLNIKSYKSDMSFSVSMNGGELEYSGASLLTLFAQKKNFLNFKFLTMIYEIVKFYSEAENDRKFFRNIAISRYLEIKNYSNYFKYNHLYPMASSIWSSPIDKISKYPFVEFVNFFSNHGLLKIFDRPKWRTVYGGSKEYVKKVLMNRKINSFKNCKATVRRNKSGTWEVKANNKIKKYDHIVLSVHSDQVSEVIENKEFEYINIFSNIKYSKNNVYLHSDISLMPKSRNVWASWNYVENKSKSEVSVTYWMNLLQEIGTDINFFVSLNPLTPPSSDKIEKKIVYDHPIYDLKTFECQKKVEMIQGKNNLWFCGAYLGYGFHEDGIKSGMKVAEDLLRIA